MNETQASGFLDPRKGTLVDEKGQPRLKRNRLGLFSRLRQKLLALPRDYAPPSPFCSRGDFKQ